jgi:hypothetical protein
MDELADYLRSAYLAEAFEIERVDEVVRSAAKLIAVFDQNGRWPYEVVPKEANDPKSSPSTSSMNLFALAAVSGHLRNSVLAPLANRSVYAISRDRLITELEALRNMIETDTTHQPFNVCYSGTYGPDDPFTILWLLELLAAFKDDSATLKAWLAELESFAQARAISVLNGEAKSLSVSGALDHIFPKIRWIQIIERLGINVDTILDVNRLTQQLENRLHQHLSYFSIADSSYDAAELAFSMEAILLLEPAKLTRGTQDRCWSVLQQSQNATPYWRPLRPFVSNDRGMVLLPLSVEIANSLIRSCLLLRRSEPSQSHLRNVAELLQKYAQWLYARRVIIRKDDEDLTGWHSEYAEDPRSPSKVHTWETSQVILFLLQHAAVVELYRANISLTLAKLDAFQPSASRGEWERRVEQESLDQIPTIRSVYTSIDELFVSPTDASRRKQYSFLLYGPQGTGKSSLAKALAAKLGWQIVVITPSDFIVTGPSEVEARAKELFDVLTVQNDVVIFFDEIDRLILDRSSRGYARQDDIFQFMTPSMLTKLQKLRDRRRAYFIIATNYAESIDPAITRVGRIDGRYLLLPPNALGRRNIASAVASEAGYKLTSAQLEEIARKTVLGVAPEIIALVETAIRRAATPESVMTAFNEAESAWKSTIQLDDYRARLRGKHFKPPYDEFLMLLFLVLEAGERPSQELVKVLRKIKLTKSIIASVIQDPSVKECLLRFLDDEGFG